MKLILCKKCNDVVKLLVGEWRSCYCGKSKGRYIDELHAEICGPCVPIGFNNFELASAVLDQPEYGPGREFTAFVIEKNCPTININKEEK